MASISDKQWQLAEDLFLAGKSLAEINKATNIARSTISTRAKNEQWIRGKNEHLIVEAVELAGKSEQLTVQLKEQLTEQQLNIHNKEVNAMLLFKGKLDTFSNKAMRKANDLMNTVEDGQGFKAIVDGVDKHTMTVGYNDRFSTSSTVIHNTNAQQNNRSLMSERDLDMEIDRALSQLAN